jgi:thioredoxin type arsenate reductase
MRYLPGMQDGNGTRRPGVLFLCVANSGRSQMAEGFARVYAPPGIEVWSAGSAPRQVHPLAVAVMAEEGIDLAGQRSKGVGEVPVDRIGTVVTLCAEEVCPTFPGSVRRLHWPLPDPAAADGDDEERRATFRAVRDEIHGRVAGLFR